jgi:hypothetical protein
MSKSHRVETDALIGAASAGGLSLESPVSRLPLTGKERGALHVLGVSTVREFLDLDVRRVLKVRRYGAVTYARLKASQEALREKPLPDRGDDAAGLFLRTSTAELKLSARGLGALARLHIDTVADFLKLDLRKRPLVRNCGPVTLRMLLAVQKSLRQRAPSDVRSGLPKGDPEKEREVLGLGAARSQMTASSLTLLPLFSGEPLSGIRAGQLHASYRPDVPISHFCRRTEREQVLTAAGIRSLGELLLAPHGRLTGPGKLSSSALAWLRSLVKEFLCGSPPDDVPRKVDYSTPESFLTSLLAPVLGDERQRRVFLERSGWRGPRPTLAALGEEYGVSRERIRQIEKKAQRKLVQWRAAVALAPLHDFVRSLLSGHSRPLSIAFICQRLQDQHKWPRPMRRPTLKKLLPAFPDLKLVGEEHVVIAEANR